MKSFAFSLLIIIACLIGVDWLFGVVNKKMIIGTKAGETFCQEYVSHHCTESIIMFGSSRMRHHYNPSIINDSLGMTCYNAGEDGGGIILNYGLYKMLSRRYNPQIIIYDFNAVYDIGDAEDNEKYLGWLRKYYDEPGIDSIIVSISKDEGVKCLSNLYRYNTRCIATFGDYIHPIRTYEKGFLPLYGKMNYDPLQSSQSYEFKYDSIKIHYLKQFINEVKRNGSLLVFFVSPSFAAKPNSQSNLFIKELAKEEGIPFYDFAYMEGVSGNKDLFCDMSHLNEDGARIWTNFVISIMKERFIND